MHDDPRLSRRDLLKSTVATAGAAALAGVGPTEAWADPPPGKLPTCKLGKTGRRVSMLALGTGYLGRNRTIDEAAELVRYALDRGITYIDTARSYHTEKHVGRGIAGRRKEVFLATKTTERDYDSAMRELEESLKDLGTDYVDLWQVHALGHRKATAKDELAHLRKPDGVMKAMRKMKQQGVVRHIGFTGHHDPDILLAVLEADEFEFETVLFVISAALAAKGQLKWEQKVLPAARRRGLGLIAMKTLGGGAGPGDARALKKVKQYPTVPDMLHYVWDRGMMVADVGLYTKQEIDGAAEACRAWAAKKRQPAGGGQPPAFEQAAYLRDLRLPFEDPDYEDARPPAA